MLKQLTQTENQIAMLEGIFKRKKSQPKVDRIEGYSKVIEKLNGYTILSKGEWFNIYFTVDKGQVALALSGKVKRNENKEVTDVYFDVFSYLLHDVEVPLLFSEIKQLESHLKFE